jgi:hypothetical protein
MDENKLVRPYHASSYPLFVNPKVSDHKAATHARQALASVRYRNHPSSLQRVPLCNHIEPPILKTREPLSQGGQKRGRAIDSG